MSRFRPIGRNPPYLLPPSADDLLPDEIKRRQDRLAAIDIAKAKIEARASARFELEQAAYQAKLKQRAARAAQTGKQPGGRPPKAPAPALCRTTRSILPMKIHASHTLRSKSTFNH